MEASVYTAGIVLVGYILIKLIDKLVEKYFKKVDTEYVEQKICDDYRKQSKADTADLKEAVDSSINSLKASMDTGFGELKGILLVVALKAGIAPEQIKELFIK